MTRNDFSPIVFSVVLFGAAIVVVAADDDESRRRRADDMMSTEMAALVQTHAQKIAQLEALVNAHQVQLDKCATSAFFTAHVSRATPAYNEAVLFDVVQADSAQAYDVAQRAYVIPVTGVYWVSVIVDVAANDARASLKLYANSALLGTADGADVSEGVFSGAFRLTQGQKLVVRRAHDVYAPGNALLSKTSFSVVLVQAL